MHLKNIGSFFLFFIASAAFNLNGSIAMASEYTFFSHLEETVNLPEHTITFLFIALIILLVGIVYRVLLAHKSNPIIPDKGISFRNIVEALGEFMYNQCVSVIGAKEGPKHFYFICGIFLIILLSNLIGLIPGFLPPTANFNTTFALGMISFVYYTFYGLKKQGPINYVKHFMGPLWWMAVLMFPIEVVSDFIRPLTLAVRLRGNMFGDHLVLGVFGSFVPYLLPIIFLAFGLLVSFIQAFVFSMLSMVYIALVVADHGHEGHEGHEEHQGHDSSSSLMTDGRSGGDVNGDSMGERMAVDARKVSNK